MRKIYLLTGWALLSGCLHAQIFSGEELLEFAAFTQKKFDSYISRKGFIPSGHFLQSDSVIHTWDLVKHPNDSITPFVHRRVTRYQMRALTDYTFQTSSQQEAMDAIRQIRDRGFTISDTNWNMQKPLLLQRREWLIQAELAQEDSVSYIVMHLRKQPMPGGRSVLYADDLLLFHSDEYLAAYFGRENVRTDQFFFSEKELHKCSVLFPNSSNQAIFIWEDGDALRGLMQVMIGGGLRTEKVAGYDGVVGNNSWKMQNGLRTHMRLEQILEASGEDLQFFGRRSPLYLSLTPESSRMLGMRNATIAFECINGGGATILDQEKVSAADAIAAGLRLHVSMLVLWPGGGEVVSSK